MKLFITIITTAALCALIGITLSIFFEDKSLRHSPTQSISIFFGGSGDHAAEILIPVFKKFNQREDARKLGVSVFYKVDGDQLSWILSYGYAKKNEVTAFQSDLSEAIKKATNIFPSELATPTANKR